MMMIEGSAGSSLMMMIEGSAGSSHDDDDDRGLGRV
jgi:hypothetical protein